MRHTMMSALKITADRIAENGLARCMTLSAFSCGYVVTNAAGMMAKYLATSLAMLNVVSAPRVISICLPVSTTSMSLVGLESRSTMLPASLAACVPVFMATATSACASPGAELAPADVDAAHARMRGEGDERAAGGRQVALAQAEALLGQPHDAATLGRFVGERGELRGVGELLFTDTGRRDEGRRLAVAERYRPGLVEQQHIDVAGGLDGASGGGDDVCLQHATHAGDPDRGQQRADGGGNEAHQQRDQRGDGDGGAEPGDR